MEPFLNHTVYLSELISSTPHFKNDTDIHKYLHSKSFCIAYLIADNKVWSIRKGEYVTLEVWKVFSLNRDEIHKPRGQIIVYVGTECYMIRRNPFNWCFITQRQTIWVYKAALRDIILKDMFDYEIYIT